MLRERDTSACVSVNVEPRRELYVRVESQGKCAWQRIDVPASPAAAIEVEIDLMPMHLVRYGCDAEKKNRLAYIEVLDPEGDLVWCGLQLPPHKEMPLALPYNPGAASVRIVESDGTVRPYLLQTVLLGADLDAPKRGRLVSLPLSRSFTPRGCTRSGEAWRPVTRDRWPGSPRLGSPADRKPRGSEARSDSIGSSRAPTTTQGRPRPRSTLRRARVAPCPQRVAPRVPGRSSVRC